MRNSDNLTSSRPHGFGEEDIERLLEDFFRQEMPAALREPAAPAVRLADDAGLEKRRRGLHSAASIARTASEADRQRGSGRIGLSAAALVLLAMFAALWSSSSERTAETIGNTNGLARTDHAAPLNASKETSAAAPLPPISAEPFEERVQPLERLTYDTPGGTVEQRTDVRWKNVSVYEPESGAKVEMLIPELSIEIFEIEK